MSCVPFSCPSPFLVSRYYTREKDRGFGDGYPDPYEVAFHTVKACTKSDCTGWVSPCCTGDCNLTVSVSTQNSGWHVVQTVQGLRKAQLIVLPDGPEFETVADPSNDDLIGGDYSKLKWSASGSVASFTCDSCSAEASLFYGIPPVDGSSNGGMYNLTASGCCWNCGSNRSSEVSMSMISPRGATGDVVLREVSGPDDPSRLPPGLTLYPRGRPRK